MKVLLLNHTFKECGVYQFGKRVYDLASRINKIDLFYRDVKNKEEYTHIVDYIRPDYIIYNWHWDRMPWLKDEDITNNKSSKHYFIYHDGSMMKVYDKYLFFGDYDPERKAVPKEKSILLPRPLLDYDGEYPVNNTITIGSFGFAFNHKRYNELVRLVSKSFNKAVINLHIPNPYFGDTPGNKLGTIIARCRSANLSSRVILNIDTAFLDDYDLLSFLARNDINIFYYSSLSNPGLSSAIDYALSVKRPIAITNNSMFRHIINDDILLEKHSIQDILNKGIAPLQQYYDKWSTDKFVSAMEKLFI